MNTNSLIYIVHNIPSGGIMVLYDIHPDGVHCIVNWIYPDIRGYIVCVGFIMIFIALQTKFMEVRNINPFYFINGVMFLGKVPQP